MQRGTKERSYQINAVASSNQLDQGIPWTRNAGLLIRCIIPPLLCNNLSLPYETALMLVLVFPQARTLLANEVY